jgi:hypothetical protein
MDDNPALPAEHTCMPEIFVSYRRGDAAGTAGRLFDRLARHFGANQVFRDLDSIEAGEDFEQAIREALRGAAAVLVVIGPHWLELRGEDGTRRIDDARDYVRREIELALASRALVVPVLVDGAALPAAEALPESIQGLAKRNAAELTHRVWDSDVEQLIARLESCGIPALERASADLRFRSAAAAVTGFLPDLFALLREPRRFLARRTRGRSAELPQTIVFFVLCLTLAAAILLSVYTPRGSIVIFGLAVLAVGLATAITLSAPLWLAWRIAGARAHYAKLLVILLYQVAVLHLVVLGFATIVMVGVELRALNGMRDILDRAIVPGASAGAALEAIGRELEPFAEATEVRVALILGALVALAGLAWAVWSWRAYRDAFGLSRTRSALALVMAIALGWAGLHLLG